MLRNLFSCLALLNLTKRVKLVTIFEVVNALPTIDDASKEVCRAVPYQDDPAIDGQIRQEGCTDARHNSEVKFGRSMDLCDHELLS